MSKHSTSLARLKAKILGHRDDDVYLNQPGRALARSILWWITALSCALFPLGLIARLVANIPAIEYWAANLAGLLLSGLLSLLLFVVVLPIVMITFPVLGTSKLPRATSSDSLK